jgi:hypothetical protein
MKHEANNRLTSATPASSHRTGAALRRVGLVPGLERLVLGTHDPRLPVRSRFGTFKLPTCFHGSEITLISNGALFGP